MSGPDLVVVARHVITVSGPDLVGRTAIVIDAGRITAVLPVEQARDQIDAAASVLDAGDRTVMPGFVDPHAHAEVAATTRYTTVDCRAPGCGSVADVLDTLRDSIDQERDGWLVGQANLFFDQKLADGRFPTRAELDSVSTDVAIAVRAGGHVSVLNTAALERAGIGADYETVTHSITGRPHVHRCDDGHATGVVSEMDKLLRFPVLSEDESRAAIIEGMAGLFTASGVTTIGEISESIGGLQSYDAGLVAGDIGTRVLVYLWTPGTVTLDDACDRSAHPQFVASPDELRVHGVKMFADGGYSAASAALTRPYARDTSSRGELAMSRPQVAEALERTRAAGLQLAVHANGDRAQLEVCAAIAEVGPGAGPPPRVEHAGNFVPDYDQLTTAWREAGIVPVPQPVFLYNFGEFIPAYVGEYARELQFPFRRLLDDGWELSGSSDVWVGSEQQQANPFFSIQCCVTRRSFHGHVIAGEEAISVREALRMHTLGGAAAMGVGSSRGSIEVGKLADLIVLDRDPLTVPDDDLATIRVDHVVTGGQTVHAPRPMTRVR
ncbi:MAG: hypothetical protein JWR55_701 [Aeromicrobium sp.]|nr:hypothetical protein [Aeromicrobium sp.]